jgi:triacylglycerol lipase
MRASRRTAPIQNQSMPLPIWQELMAGVEMAFLRVSPVFWGYGVPHGDGAAVVLIPGFLGTDFYLMQFRAWLQRIGYRPFYSGIQMNAECPNLLIRRHVHESIQAAWKSTRRKIHIIGHSLGGSIALSAAAQNPNRVASVITLGAPLRAVVGHRAIIRTAEVVRKQILERNGNGVLPNCYTGACTCDFLESLQGQLPKSVRQTAIFTKTDGILDWHVCQTGDPSIDCEVSATHIGLVFSPIVYSLVAQRLAGE